VCTGASASLSNVNETARSAPLRALATFLLGAILIGCGSTQPSPSAPAGTPSEVPAATLAPSPSATIVGPPSPSPTESASLTDRPFTVLVLGGDNNFRTDSIMVVGVDPVAGTLAMASIPRDTINMPLPGGGTFANQKINAFYDFAAAHPNDYPRGPGRATADLVGGALGIKIDYYAATSFAGFVAIIDAFGGVTVDVPKVIVDSTYQVTKTQIGIRFLKGPQKLNGQWSLIFVRTRHADNDFERARRQQLFLLSAGQKLLAQPALLAALMGASRNLVTDVPLAEIPALLGIAGRIDLSSVKQAVLGPSTYESAASCTCGYALAPKIAEMRKLAAIYFPWAVVP
jgi:LCP family protein required for cell wall assembly